MLVLLILLVHMCGNLVEFPPGKLKKSDSFKVIFSFTSKTTISPSIPVSSTKSKLLPQCSGLPGNLKQQIHSFLLIQLVRSFAFQEAIGTSPGLSQGGKKETTNQHDVQEAKLQQVSQHSQMTKP